MYKLKIISSTVRPGRKGRIVAEWIAAEAAKTGDFEIEVIDLGELNLPLMNETAHPILRQYVHEHTKKWSATVQEADAFIFVTTEYNYGYPASLRNALEYLHHEWGYKPAGLVSYSAGAFAGVRAAMSLKTDLLTLRCVSLAEVVNIPFLPKLLNEKNELAPSELMQQNAALLLKQLKRWTKGMKAIREDV